MRAHDEHVARMALAQMTVAIYAMARNKKKVPILKELLAESGAGERGKQSVHQMKSMLTVLSGQYGIPLQKAKVH